jgi:hypothetical protein
MAASSRIVGGRREPLKLLRYENNQISVRVVYSQRRTLGLYVYPDKRVELKVPRRCPAREIDNFLKDKIDWILRKQAYFNSIPQPVLPSYVDGTEHLFLGHPHRLILVEASRPSVCKLQDSILLTLPEPGNPDKVRALFEKWLRTMAIQDFPLRLQRLYKPLVRLKLPTPHLSVRKMKARWGSCSRTGDICLNSLLVQKPEAAIDYVITHELCHLREFSHSKAFYGLLDQVMPDWRAGERLLGDQWDG